MRKMTKEDIEADHGGDYVLPKREPLPVRTESTGWANVAGVLIGVGLAMGSGPIILASILIKRNMFIEIIDGLDLMWKRLDASNDNHQPEQA